MLRVLYDYQIWTMQKYGGVSRYFYELIKRGTESRLFRAEVWAGLIKNEYGLEKLSGEDLLVRGKKIPDLPRTGRAWQVLGLVNKNLFNGWFRLCQNRYDIYHPTYYHTGAKRFKGRQVITVFDMIHELYPQLFLADDTTSRSKKLAVESADAVIAISESTKRDLINMLGIDEQKVFVVYLANSLVHDPGGYEAIIQKPYILYVGNRRGYKNFVHFIQAYALNRRIMSDFQLVVFGGEKITPAERRELEELKVHEKVNQITGDDEVLINLYKNAACFVYPSLHEGFGIPPLEAMHYGCPVAASNAGSIPEIVGEAGVLFNPRQPEDIARALEMVLYDEELRESLVKKGYQHEKMFSWERCARETGAIYDKLGE